MNENNKSQNKEKYKKVRIKPILFKYNKKKDNYDSENIIKLKEMEDLYDTKENNEIKKAIIYYKINFAILIIFGIIVTIHIIHYLLSEYVRKIFNKKHL